MTVLYAEGMSDGEESLAKQVLADLTQVYPHHPWSVRVAGGMVIIKHLEFGPGWGMTLRMKEADHDAAVLKRKCMMLAGEWLERAGLRRGLNEEHDPYYVEGVPQEDQHRSFKEPAITEKNNGDGFS